MGAADSRGQGGVNGHGAEANGGRWWPGEAVKGAAVGGVGVSCSCSRVL
jgi:hypothetical protein